MIIETLYPELGNLFGDPAQLRYLKLCLKEAEFVETALDARPAFLDREVALIYMGPMTEKGQERAIENLFPFKDALSDQIRRGTHFLFTGNSMELLGKYIRTDASELPALDILDMYAVRKMRNRHNSLFLGTYEDMRITGFNSRFSHCYPSDTLPGFCKVVRGIGLNEQHPYEGIHVNNLIGTYLLGPLLILNPRFTAHLLSSLGHKSPPAFFEEALLAYRKRLSEFQDKQVKLD
jgi:CobQ-like glutamine amidotransferase family enzyme